LGGRPRPPGGRRNPDSSGRGCECLVRSDEHAPGRVSTISLIELYLWYKVGLTTGAYCERRLVRVGIMTSPEYKKAYRRFTVMALATLTVVILPIAGVGLYSAHAVAIGDNSLTKLLRSHFDPTLIRPIVFAVFLPILCFPFAIFGRLLRVLARYCHCSCPHCGRSLLLKCDSRLINKDGLCPDCRMSVISFSGGDQ
jgi:hypothetical protein